MKATLLLHILLLTAIRAQNPTKFCRSKTTKCSFRFCNINTGKAGRVARRFNIQAANLATITPVICRRSFTDNVARILTTGEPVIIEDGPKVLETPLKDWTPPNLSPNFPPNFFFAGDSLVVNRSGLYRKEYAGNQRFFINETCIKLPILSYQKIPRGGGDPINVTTRGRKKRDCVSFVPFPTNLKIRFEWDTSDDLDLVVTEPGGAVLNKFDREGSVCGTLRRDDGTDGCFGRGPGPAGGAETIQYRTCDPPLGVYQIRAEHFSNCGRDGETTWRLTVSREGVIIREMSGVSDGNLSSDIFDTTVLVE